MRGLKTFCYALGLVGAGVFGTALAANEPAGLTLQPAVLSWSDGAQELLLISGRHGGHRHHGGGQVFHHDSRHFRHFDNHRHFRHFDDHHPFVHRHGHHKHFIHDHRLLHRGNLGVSFCLRSNGVLFCFNDSVRHY